MTEPRLAFPRAPVIAFALLAVGLTLSSLFSLERIPLFRDVVFFFIPFQQAAVERLRIGELPLWNPLLFLGMPLLANLQSGALYPPSLLFWLPMPGGFNAFLILHYSLAFGGIFSLLRSRGLGVVATTLGSITFVIGGYAVSMMNVTTYLLGLAWAPWVLLAWHRFLDEPGRVRFCAVALVLALQALSAGIEIELMTLTVVAAGTLWRHAWEPHVAFARASQLMLAVALSLGVASVQVLPTVELVRETARGAALDFEEASMWSLEPVSLLQLLLPHSSSLVSEHELGGLGQRLERHQPWIVSLYLGLAPLVAAIGGLFVARDRRFWGIVAAGAILFALGSHGPLYPFLYDVVPWLVGKFRFPEKLYFVAHLAASVLAAEGFEALLARDSRAFRAALAASITFLVVLGSFCALRWIDPIHFLQSMWVLAGNPSLPPSWALATGTDLYFKAARAIIILLVLTTVLVLWRRGWIRDSICALTILALAAADLGSTHHNLNLSMEWARFAEQPVILDADQVRKSGERIYHYEIQAKQLRPAILSFPTGPLIGSSMLTQWGELYPNSAMFHGVPAFVGAEAFRPRAGNFLFRAVASVPIDRGLRILGAYSVRYLIGTGEIESGVERVPIATRFPSTVYRLRDVAPRAYLAGRLHEAKTELSGLNRLIDPGFVLGRDAAVERLPEGWVDAAPDEPIGTVTIDRYENEEIEISVRADRRALLVLNDAFFPGWRARLDGKEVEIVRTNLFVRGMLVEPGAHEVQFSYDPWSFRFGLLISCMSVPILSFLWLSGRRRSRRSV